MNLLYTTHFSYNLYIKINNYAKKIPIHILLIITLISSYLYFSKIIPFTEFDKPNWIGGSYYTQFDQIITIILFLTGLLKEALTIVSKNRQQQTKVHDFLKKSLITARTYPQINNLLFSQSFNKHSEFTLSSFLTTLIITIIYLPLAWHRYLIHLAFFIIYYQIVGAFLYLQTTIIFLIKFKQYLMKSTIIKTIN